MTYQSAPNPLRLLYLGFAFPPGVAALYPDLNPAGHSLETQMISELRAHAQIRSVGVLPLIPPTLEDADPDSGISHELILLDKAPEFLHRVRSLARLKAQYLAWRAAGWEPDVVLVYNLSPIYNQFLLWLSRQPKCPKLALLLLDSSSLGRSLSKTKRLRYRFKPMVVLDSDMLSCFDACIGLSRTVSHYFESAQIPFLWMPGGCSTERALAPGNGSDVSGGAERPLRFGYFGALAPHAGIESLVEAFLASGTNATLHVCGYGKLGERLAEISRREPRIKFRGLLPSAAHCLRFGHACDVLVNPRPNTHGNENNFPSKLFEYALAGRAILTSKLSGVEEVLGPEAYYVEPQDLTAALGRKIADLSAVPRAELSRRGAAIQRRILGNYSWQRQAGQMAEFLTGLCGSATLPAITAQEIAA